MNKKEFSKIRRYLGKTQKEMAQLLGTSVKAVQSFEQGWRNIPAHIERQALFLLAMKRDGRSRKPCWVRMKCPSERRQSCPAWEFNCGEFCWFINGTVCHGVAQNGWKDKIVKCKRCKVFRSMLPARA